MYEAVFLLLGIIIGIIIAAVLNRNKTGYGFFKLEKIPDEEDLYTIKDLVSELEWRLNIEAEESK